MTAIHRGQLALVAGFWLIAGCGATGLNWVDEPEPASGWSGSEQSSQMNTRLPRMAGADVVTATADPDAATDTRPRLNHTVTLGEVDATPPAASAVATGSGVSVTINNYNAGGAPGPGYYGGGYASFGYSRVGGGSRIAPSGVVTGASRSSGSAMQPGQNWPSVADHGSSFPYRSAPASPWARAQ